MTNYAEWSQPILTLVGMLFLGIAFVWAIKGDTRVLAERLDTVDRRLDKIDSILERLSDIKGRLDVLDERLLAQGKRVDEASKAVTGLADRFGDFVRRGT